VYPATFFGLFPPFPRDLQAFVAMSFDPHFDARWVTVLKRGLELVLVKGQPLEAHRLDLAMAGDSVLTGVLEKIGRCQVVVADISSHGVLDGRPVRNENVFYEVALAHAVRLPEEVVLFRSDRDPLAFDISNVRVHQYDPDSDPATACRMVADVVSGSLNELQLRRHLSIRRAADSLTAECFFYLVDAQKSDGALPPYRRNMDAQMDGAMRDAISRLLDLSAIRPDYLTLKPGDLDSPEPIGEFVRYRTTPFGTALLAHMRDTTGMKDVYEQMKNADGAVGRDGQKGGA
jgi:hypothetical protein